MSAKRASIFPIEDDLDVAGFTPAPKITRPKTEAAAIRETAERTGFRSREPGTSPRINDDLARPQRRYTTGRNRQLNLKVTDGALCRFYALAEAQGWVLGHAFEEAVTALEANLDEREPWDQATMTAFKARVRIDTDHRISGIASADVPAGDHEVTILVAAGSALKFFRVEDLPVHDLPWDPRISLRREDIYGDDGR